MNIKSFFHSDLYNKYYPIKTESERQAFLNENKVEPMIGTFIVELKEKIINREKYFKKQLKNPKNIFGKEDSVKAAENEVIESKMNYDSFLNDFKEWLEDLERMKNKIKNHEENLLTEDDLNIIIKYSDKARHKTLGIYAFAAALFIAIAMFSLVTII